MNFDEASRLIGRRVRGGMKLGLTRTDTAPARGDLPINVIAAQMGYATPYSFSSAFRRKFGDSPSSFRT